MNISRKRHRIPLTTAVSCLQPIDLGLKKSLYYFLWPCAGTEPPLSRSIPFTEPQFFLLLVNRLTLPQSCCLNEDGNEAGLSPRSTWTGEPLDEVRSLTGPFLLPFLGYHSNTSIPPPKRRKLVILPSQPTYSQKKLGRETAIKVQPPCVPCCLEHLFRDSEAMEQQRAAE